MNYDNLKTFSTGLHSSPMLLIIEVNILVYSEFNIIPGH